MDSSEQSNDQLTTGAIGPSEPDTTLLTKAPMSSQIANGPVVGLSRVEIGMPIRQRTKAELNLAADAFETHDALMITDADSNILRVNKAFETITGYTEEDVLGKNSRILKSGRHGKSFYLALWQGLLHDGFWSGEIWDKHKNGDIYPKYLTITAIQNSEGVTTQYVASFIDITDRKKDEIELNKFRAIIDSSDDAIISKTLDGIIESWNLGAEKIFGYTANEVIGNSMEILIPSDRRHEETEILALIKLGEKVKHFETVRRRKDGRLIDLSVTISPILDDKGKVIGASKIARDIGLRKEAEKIKRESENRIKTILDNLFSYVALLDIDGKVQEINKAPLVRAGYRYDDVVGQFFYDAPWWSYDSTVRTQLMEAMEAARQGRTNRYDVKVKMGDDLIPIDFQISPVYDTSGKLVGLLPTAVDITERKRQEQMLQETQAIVDSTDDAIISKTLKGVITSWNYGAQKLFGFTAEEAINSPMSMLIPPDRLNEEPEILACISRGERVEHFETVRCCKNGQLVDISATISPILNDKGDVIGASKIARDISERKKNETLLSRHKVVIDTAKDGFWVVDMNGNLLEVNQAYADISGYRVDQLIRMNTSQLEAIENRAEVATHISKIIEQGHDLFETRHRHKDGHLVEIEVSANYMPEAQQIFAFCRDITDRKLAEESLKLASLVYLNSGEAMAVTDAESKILTVNHAFTELTGYSEEEVIGKNPKILSSGRQDADFYKNMWKSINTTGQWRGEIWNKRKNGEHYAELLTINTIYDDKGSVQRRVALFTDITDRKNAELEVLNQANFDQLTGLPNRRLFQDRLEQEIRKSQREKQMTALMLLDLDHFKEVNDTQGHDVGDTLLVEAATRIKSCVRSYDTVARLGGDEFTVILSELSDFSDIGRVAQNIIDSLSKPFLIKGRESFVSASIGIAIYPEDADNTIHLIKSSDQAMYKAKNDGRGRFCYFTKVMQEVSALRMQLAADLRYALKANQLEVHYQPIVNLSNNQINKAEALMRWKHPEHGYISPATFIPIAEEIGIIHDIGDWIFMQSALQVKKLMKEHGRDFQISVNKSPVQFKVLDGKHNHWIDKLKTMELLGSSIAVEITEGLLMNKDGNVEENLLRFRDAGIQVAIDDFGTGYSALSYLKKFHIDYLKIDQSFTQNLTQDSADFALCEAIVVMAHKLGLKVIAEGVETEQQRDLLKQINCDYGQGYLFSRPVPAEEFEALLTQV